MRYAYIQGTWQSDRSNGWKNWEDRRNVARELNALAQLVSPQEYEEMLSQWRQGEREIRIENGFVMTCYTPPQ